MCAAAERFPAARDGAAAATDKLVCRGWAFFGGFEKFVPLGEENSGEI